MFNQFFLISGGLSRQSSSNMTPNVSDLTGSPPKPVSTLVQHNYSNIHQPIPRPTSLTSSRTQSSNTSPINAESPSGGVALLSSVEGGAFTKLIKNSDHELEKKSKLSQVHDLIHLETSKITEDLVIRTLQSRFFNHKYFVSNHKIGFYDLQKFDWKSNADT